MRSFSGILASILNFLIFLPLNSSPSNPWTLSAEANISDLIALFQISFMDDWLICKFFYVLCYWYSLIIEGCFLVMLDCWILRVLELFLSLDMFECISLGYSQPALRELLLELTLLDCGLAIARQQDIYGGFDCSEFGFEQLHLEEVCSFFELYHRNSP